MIKEKTRLWTKDFIGIAIINVLIFIAYQLQLSAMPIYLYEISAGMDSVVGLSTALTTIAAIAIRPFAGRVIDALGRRAVMLTGIGFLALALLMYTFIDSVTAVLAVRFIFGLGWGISTTSSNTIATDIVPKERFGEGMGYFSLSQSISLAIAPAIGLFLLEAVEFKGLSFVSLGLLAPAVISALIVRYRKVKASKKKFEPYEKRAVRPSVIMTFVGIGIGSTFGFAALYGKSLGIPNVGLFFTLYATTLFITRPMVGRLIDKMGFKVAVYSGFFGFIISMILLFVTRSQVGFLVAALIQGASYGAVQPSIQTMAVVNCPAHRRGAANATYFTGFDIGIGTGGMIAGLLASAFGYSNMFALMSIPLTIGLLLYHFLASDIIKLPDEELEEIIEETAEDVTVIDI